MSDAKKLIEGKRYPSFIASHAIWKKFPTVKKIYPEIGLPNSESEIEIDNNAEAKQSAMQMVNVINQLITKRLQTIDKFSKKKANMGDKRKHHLATCLFLLNGVKELVAKPAYCMTVNNGRITLNLPTNIGVDGTIHYRAGESLFRVYNKLNETLREGKFLAMQKLDDVLAFKEFSAKNMPAVKYKLRFSSDGEEGLWDIATMSMRGVDSCQSWSAGNSTHLVGSMVDPFTGIIYMTNGTKHNDYGSKMIKRCVVRFLVNEKKKRPLIGLERMYPSYQKEVYDGFVKFIKERTEGKFEVIYLGDRNYTDGNYVPLSKIVNSLPPHEQPYRDSGLAYKADVNDVQGRIKEQLQTKLDMFYGTFASKVIAAARSIKVASLPKESRPAFRALRGSDATRDYSYNVYQDLYAMARKMVEDLKIDNYENAETYLKDGISTFINNSIEDAVFNAVKSSAKKTALTAKIDDNVLRSWSKVASDKLVTFCKEEADKVVAKTTGKSVKKNVDNTIPTYVALLH